MSSTSEIVLLDTDSHGRIVDDKLFLAIGIWDSEPHPAGPTSFRLLNAYGSGVCGGVSLFSNAIDRTTVLTLRDGSHVQNHRVTSVRIVFGVQCDNWTGLTSRDRFEPRLEVNHRPLTEVRSSWIYKYATIINTVFY
jgi:hypothetical protein